MIPFDELCGALDRWSRQRELNGEQRVAPPNTSTEAPRREPRPVTPRAVPAVAAVAAAGGGVAAASWAAPAPLDPAPSGPITIESGERPIDEPTGEIDLEDVIDI